ncbi:hypothetical protein CL1_1274 [Thermococcus cleftensis]|uniref:KaiC-like domain-containing protein n=1 Tax=Thermococcus cleftensis (strain DSM 27260 / KACC 17922 / CL1) TaxID=163003 RepID=I3ZUT9_THECF|nr:MULTISPECIES: DUF257 family protein [Thermococcus]AFL95473.1 hypothetical protein CL1_1274 [Thermococcus cleftensis]NJE04008.1 hypothetical protein [Thermococcus sp. MV11]
MAPHAVDSILFGLRPGETVLIEYSAVSSPELLLYLICRRCRARGTPLIIDDISDAFAESVIRLDLMGLELEGLRNAPVIKIGGSREIGRVFGRVEVDKYSLDFRYYNEIYEKIVPEEVVFNPVLGIHKLFIALERHEVMRLIRNISTFVGKKSRVALYFLNADIMERYSPELLSFFEETASTVIRWDFEGGKYRLRVIKAANASIVGSTASLSFKDISRQ